MKQAKQEQQKSTLRPADLAGGKLSLRARVKAFSMTRLQVASDKWGARLPSRMVVLALIGGSSSTCIHLHFILYLTVWGVTPVVTQQTSWLERKGVHGAQQNQAGGSSASYHMIICTNQNYTHDA